MDDPEDNEEEMMLKRYILADKQNPLFRIFFHPCFRQYSSLSEEYQDIIDDEMGKS